MSRKTRQNGGGNPPYLRYLHYNSALHASSAFYSYVSLYLPGSQDHSSLTHLLVGWARVRCLRELLCQYTVRPCAVVVVIARTLLCCGSTQQVQRAGSGAGPGERRRGP